MVIADDIFDGIREVNALEDVSADGGVNLHLREFSFSQLTRLVEDVFRYGELADVMQ